jgi:hypothetical protein
MVQEEKDTLLRDLDAAKSQLAEVQAACSSAKAISATTEQQLHLLEHQLKHARYVPAICLGTLSSCVPHRNITTIY